MCEQPARDLFANTCANRSNQRSKFAVDSLVAADGEVHETVLGEKVHAAIIAGTEVRHFPRVLVEVHVNPPILWLIGSPLLQFTDGHDGNTKLRHAINKQTKNKAILFSQW